jgi:hypothetical protein
MTRKNKRNKNNKNNKKNKNVKKITNKKKTYNTKGGNKTLKKLNCSPKKKHEINDFSCYTDESIFRLKDLWNARHPDVKIRSNDSKKIHAQLTQYLSDVCNTEACWLKQHHKLGKIHDPILKESFAPESPAEWKKNPNEWLSSVDIMKVMKQYEKAYTCFDFIGPSPINFDTKELYGECVWEELCHFSLAQLKKKGKHKIGIIFNTDPHHKPGEHWISMFINIKKGKIFFFDSVGDPAPKEVKKLADRIIEQGLQLHPKIHFEYDENHPVEHQYGNSECGVYSLYFLIHMLEDKVTQEYLKTHI